MHSLKVCMVTMETTHKINCWQYMYAMIMSEVALLNVYCVYNCNFLEYKYRNNIFSYKYICMYWHTLSTNRFNVKIWALHPPFHLIDGEEGRQKSTIFCTIIIVLAHQQYSIDPPRSK